MLGPELVRIPLIYARNDQIVLRLRRLVEKLRAPGSGLITPVECVVYSNGVQVLFRPPKDAYQSAKEEKRAEKEKDAQAATGPSKSLYVSPEKDAMLANEQSVTKSAVKKKVKPEGGLEIVVEKDPFRRVRVSRCNMGPDTIVKEESEAVILKEIVKAVATLENDYKIIMSKVMQ